MAYAAGLVTAAPQESPTLPPWLPAWALAPLLTLVTAGGVALVFLRPDWILGAVLAVVIGSGFLWVLISAFTPAEADRTCPSCGEESLERLEADSTRGLRCTACDFVDPAASGWFLAEDEGPLEHLVLAERRRKRERKAAASQQN